MYLQIFSRAYPKYQFQNLKFKCCSILVLGGEQGEWEKHLARSPNAFSPKKGKK